MSYSDFNLKQVREQFQLTLIDVDDLFCNAIDVSISQSLIEILNYNVPLAMAIGTEKAKSELIVTNILLEVRKKLDNKISFFSGINLDVDKEKGLIGFCDFVISKSQEQFCLSAPIITLVEAKNDNIGSGLGQCIAEMLAASLFNEKEKKPLATLYGVVTTGNIWKFLKLENNTVYIDLKEYYIIQPEKIVAVLISMINELS
jgi:hypothetical protein